MQWDIILTAMGLELLLPFIASLIVVFTLRRIDKGNMRLGQLKKFTTKLTEDIQQASMTGVQSVKDVQIDLDILQKQSKKLLNDLNTKYSDTKVLIESLKANKEYLDSLTMDLNGVVGLTTEIKNESMQVQEGLKIVQDQKLEIQKIYGSIHTVKSEIDGLMVHFQEKINVNSANILESLASKIVELESLLETKSEKLDEAIRLISESYREKLKDETEILVNETVGKVDIAHNKLDNYISIVRESERNIDTKMLRFRDTAEMVSNSIERMELQYDDKLKRINIEIEEQINLMNKKVEDKFELMLNQVSSSKETFLKGMKQEVNSLKNEIEGMSLETMTRRDEILNDTRRQSENINASIVLFQEKYLEAENKLLKQADQKKNELFREIDRFEEDFKRVNDTFMEEVDTSKGTILKSLNSFENELSKAATAVEVSTREKFFNLKNELEESLIEVYTKRKNELMIDLNKIETKITGLGMDTAQKIRNVDEHFSDLKKALVESARDIISQVESDISGIAVSLDKEKTRVDQKLEDFYTLKDKLEESMISLHKKKKDEFQEDLSRIEHKIDNLNQDLVSKIKFIDDHFSDLKKALVESAKEIIAQVETDVSQIANNLDKEKVKIDQKFEHFSEVWDTQLDKIKHRTSKDVENLNDRLKDIHIQGAELVNTFKHEFSSGKVLLENLVKKNIDNMSNQTGQIVQEIQSKVKRSQNEVESLLVRIHKAGINLYEKQESLLSEYGEKLFKDIQGKLEKAKSESEVVLQDIHKTGFTLLERQQEKIDKFNSTIDERISRQLTILLDRGQFQIGQIESRITSYVKDVKDSLEKLLSQAREDGNKQIDTFNVQFHKNFKEIEKANHNLIESSRVEFEKTKQEFAKIKLSLDADIFRIADIKTELFHQLNDESNKLKSSLELISEKIQNLKGYTEIIDNTEKIIAVSDTKIIEMKSLIHLVKEEESNLNMFLSQVDFIKTAKKGLESELTEIEGQRGRIDELESELLSLGNTCDDINHRASLMMSKLNDIHSIEEKIQKLELTESELKERFELMQSTTDKLQTMGDVVLAQSKNADELNQKIIGILEGLDHLQTKEQELKKTIDQIDKKTSIIHTRNVDIKSIESKFDKVESLMLDLSTRHKQIATLQKRIETLKSDTEGMKDSLEQLLSEADDKFIKLNEFLEVVETYTSGSASKMQRTRHLKDNSEIIKRKKSTVLNLYENFDWSPDTIADKLNIERSLVDAIINSRSS